MKQKRIKAAFIRGGTSKGVFFRAGDLPEQSTERDAILLRALGSPDPYERQLDGLGGGLSSLSKAVIIGRSARDDADIDYTFAQVSVDAPLVDYAGTCGNLSSATGPFTVDEGLIQVDDGEAVIRVFNTNTSKIFLARFDVRDGEATVEGEQRIPGVSHAGARVALEFLSPGGSMTCGLLPTGNVVDEVETADGKQYRVSLIDATNPIVMVNAGDVGISAREQPDALEMMEGLLGRLDMIRRAAGVVMGLGETLAAVPQAVPKIVVVARPQTFRDIQGETVEADEVDLCARAVSMGRLHRALPLTLSMCVATACRIEGTVPAMVSATLSDGADVRLGNPSGIIAAGADVVRSGNSWDVSRCRVIRTQRRLMEGSVLVPASTT
ncbi:MAG: PrpF family protein [Hyphomicrobiaceae bacterium]